MRRRWSMGVVVALAVAVSVALGHRSDARAIECAAAAALELSPVRIVVERTPRGVRVELRI